MHAHSKYANPFKTKSLFSCVSRFENDSNAVCMENRKQRKHSAFASFREAIANRTGEQVLW